MAIVLAPHLNTVANYLVKCRSLAVIEQLLLLASGVTSIACVRTGREHFEHICYNKDAVM